MLKDPKDCKDFIRSKYSKTSKESAKNGAYITYNYCKTNQEAWL